MDEINQGRQWKDTRELGNPRIPLKDRGKPFNRCFKHGRVTQKRKEEEEEEEEDLRSHVVGGAKTNTLLCNTAIFVFTSTKDYGRLGTCE